jgi:hypothetical protein
VKHFWQEIEGYFTFPDFYAYVARAARREQLRTEEANPWRGVEVGVYTGQSAAFLGVELKNRGVWGDIDLVDIELTKHRARENLARLIEPMGAIGRFLEMQSTAAAQLYDDRSLDFVFIDADHAYAAVARDIDAWRPKVKSGGLLAGHDFCNWQGFGVIEAVTERFERFSIWRGSKGMGDAQMQPRYWPVWAVPL